MTLENCTYFEVMAQWQDKRQRNAFSHVTLTKHLICLCTAHYFARKIHCVRVCVCICVLCCRWPIRGEALARWWDHHDQWRTCQFGSERTSHRPCQVAGGTLEALWELTVVPFVRWWTCQRDMYAVYWFHQKGGIFGHDKLTSLFWCPLLLSMCDDSPFPVKIFTFSFSVLFFGLYVTGICFIPLPPLQELQRIHSIDCRPTLSGECISSFLLTPRRLRDTYICINHQLCSINYLFHFYFGLR